MRGFGLDDRHGMRDDQRGTFYRSETWKMTGSPHRTAILAGATGLVGGHLLQLLLADPRYRRVITVSRKELGIEHPKLRSLITNFDTIEAAMADLSERSTTPSVRSARQ